MGIEFTFYFFLVYNVVINFRFYYNIVLLFLALSGDIETNPGPNRHRQCRMLYSNIRGLNANLNDLIGISRQYDILFCSETLVSNFRHSSELQIPGFKKPILFRRNAIQGAQGMATYIRKDFAASRKSIYECGCHEMQTIKVCGQHHNFYLFSVYRNPNANDSIFECLLTKMAAIQENDRKSSFLFVGDFNVHHREWLNSVSPTDGHGVRAFDFSNESGCDQLINRPTHRSGNPLDLIFTDVPGVVNVNVGSPIGTSDHAYISAIIKIKQPIPAVNFSRKIYLKSQADWNSILHDLSILDWSNLYHQEDLISNLNSMLIRVIERHIPSRVITFRNKDKAWFDDDCRRAHLDKHEAFRLWQRNRSHITWENYVRLRSIAQRTYNDSEKRYNETVKDTLLGASSPHKWWSTLKSALFGNETTIPPILKPDGSLTHCPKEKATLFADAFDSKQSNIKLSMPSSCFPEPKLTSLAFRSREVRDLLLSLDSYGGAGPDDIFPLFFIKTAPILASRISTIFRKLIRGGCFSLNWRLGNIVPVAKSDISSAIPSDFRPISITPVLSKVFERLLAKRLALFAEKNSLLPTHQFGFRKGLGTCDALLTISDSVQKALDSGMEARIIGLDFSSAFDCVNHEALIFKLKLLGVGGHFLNILIEFLSNRSQRVVVDGQYSDYRPVISGVPQGSVLGPLLFILYTHDMWFGLENTLVAYADDATLYASIPSPRCRNEVAESLNRDLARICTWCQSWGMKLNVNKTQSMIISRSRTVDPPHPDLLINNAPLTPCNSFKILGVTLDSKFTFEKHVRNISSSVAQKIGILRKSFRIFGDQAILRKCFNCFILPCFEYCSPVWSSAANSHLKLLDRNLNAIKYLIPDLNTNLWHRRSVSSLCMLHKIYHNVEHPLNSCLPNLYHAPRNTRHAANVNSFAFSFVRFNTTQFSRSFIPSITGLWNRLPSSVVESSDLQKFKLRCNIFLLNEPQ